MAPVLIVPGLNDSGPAHWQTWWQATESGTLRVVQDDWQQPDLGRWSARVAESLDQTAGPVWLVAHSFGCLASVAAVARRPGRIKGALLVAPADPERFGLGITFPQRALPFPSIVVASTNDPWMRFDRAAQWAGRWGSRLVNLGRAGHINSESGYGPWPKGRALLRELCQRAPRTALPPSFDSLHFQEPTL